MKRSPWPYAITAFVLLLIAAVVGFSWYSTTLRFDLVTPSYYEEELRYQEQIDREQRTRALDRQPQLLPEEDDRALLLDFPAHLRPEGGSLTFYRPSDASLDHSVELALDESGQQVVRIDDLAAGLWRLQLRWTSGSEEYSLDQQLVLEPPP